MSVKKADIVWVKGGSSPREAVVLSVSPEAVEVRFVITGQYGRVDPSRVSREMPKG
jgi:hypothetical protein